MSDIVTLNGYKIKDEKAIRSYETVALMKADTKLKEGYHVRTKGYYEANDGGHGEYIIVDDETLVNDGGSIHVLSNGLRAKLILKDEVNPEQFGAYGDNTHDDILNIQSLLDYVASNNKYKVVMNKEYLITDTLEIKYNNCQIEINGTLNYTGETDSAVYYNGDLGHLYIHKILSSYDGIVIEGNSTQTSAYNEFNFDYILADHDGIVEYANNGWLQYNEFRFKNIRADNIGINLKSVNNATTSWITESKYWGGHISAKGYPGYNEYCIYIDGTSAKTISTQKFYNIGFEGTKKGCHIENASACVFEHFRNRESIQTKLFELVGVCSRNEFYGEGIYMKWLDWSGLTTFSYPNTFHGTFLTDGGSMYHFTEFSVDHTGMKYCNQNAFIYANNSTGETVYTLDSTKSWYGFPTQILMGNNVDLILDTKYYNYLNINTLYLMMASSTSNGIKDTNGNTLVDFTGKSLGYKKLKITFFQQAQPNFSPDGILVEEVTPIV